MRPCFPQPAMQPRSVLRHIGTVVAHCASPVRADAADDMEALVAAVKQAIMHCCLQARPTLPQHT
jgi:hypothetical protein